MTRKECLDKAAECVLQDRASQYGGPENNFGRIAKLWSTYTGTVLDGIDVAMMMALLKIARIKANRGYADGYVDLAGYAACGAECASGKPAPKAEGCEALVEKDAPQTAQELYDRILSVNPATYGHPRKPTGEELAEMAEEEPHG